MKDFKSMVNRNASVAETKEQTALEAIEEALVHGEQITPKALVDKTGLSRSMFYHNPRVAEAMKIAQEKQEGKVFVHSQKDALNTAMKKDNENLRKLLSERDKMIEKLKKENDVLRKQIYELA